ncbi:MAG: TonB-dependent receptor, partial [Emcibacteraceae bacterium]|nr:TonB-dependent receptor [Emcibacteraceae bacterium]
MNTSSTKYYAKYLLGGASAIAIATSSMVASAQEGDAAQDAAQDNDSGGIETIIVTATKRAVNVQDIPSSVQAISGEALQEMGAHNAEDFMRFIPAVSFVSSTPGSNDIIFRGINIGLGSYIGQAAASMYLDEASLTSSGSQPDVRMVDIAGVEALSGPQGTLYGDSAQAGVLRITTNKPKFNEFEAILEAGMRTGKQSDRSWDVSGIFNIPLVEDKFAIRLVAERARDGGFISNVLGNTPDGHAYYFYDNAVIGYQFPDWGTVDNSHVVEENWNGVDYLTGRFSAKLNLNEDWDATFSFAHQENEINGGDGGYNPFVGDLQTVNFNKYFREDKWDMYSLVLEGDLGWAQLVSSTSFFKRTIDNSYDTTVYAKYYAAWACYSPDGIGGDPAYARYCLGTEAGSDVLAASSYPEQQQKFAQEIRLSGQAGNVDWLVGAYLEDSSVKWDGDFDAPTNFDYQDSLSLAYFENDLYPGETFPTAVAPWGSSDDTSWKQYAVFGESTWHIGEKLHLTMGARYFQRENSKFYKAFQPDTKLNPDFAPDLPAGQANKGKDRQFVPKVSLSYDVSEDSMIYALYTTGY